MSKQRHWPIGSIEVVKDGIAAFATLAVAMVKSTTPEIKEMGRWLIHPKTLVQRQTGQTTLLNNIVFAFQNYFICPLKRA